MNVRTLIVALTIGFQAALVAQAPPASQGPTASAGNADTGKKIYRERGCWQCHNPEGQGGEAPRLVPPSMTLPAFIAYIRRPKGAMPPYLPRVASDTDLTDIYAFLRIAPKPLTASSIPLLNN